jgi:two-component sensor histidine kinase
VLRILQEALVNVRRHSGANNVLVQFRRTGNHWQLAVEDDGGRFPFSGLFSQKELEASGRGPFVIKECVLSIGGELMIETIPGRISRLEITIPAKRRAAYWKIGRVSGKCRPMDVALSLVLESQPPNVQDGQAQRWVKWKREKKSVYTVTSRLDDEGFGIEKLGARTESGYLVCEVRQR